MSKTNNITVQEFLDYCILKNKAEIQIKMVLKYLESYDKNAKNYCDHWSVEEINPDNITEDYWTKELFVFGDKYLKVNTYAVGVMGPTVVSFPIGYLFMSENALKEEISKLVQAKQKRIAKYYAED